MKDSWGWSGVTASAVSESFLAEEGVSKGMLPQKILKLWVSRMAISSILTLSSPGGMCPPK